MYKRISHGAHVGLGRFEGSEPSNCKDLEGFADRSSDPERFCRIRNVLPGSESVENCGASLTVDFGFTERRERSDRSGVKPKSTAKLAEQSGAHGNLGKIQEVRHNRSGSERSEAQPKGFYDPHDFEDLEWFRSSICIGFAQTESYSRFTTEGAKYVERLRIMENPFL